VAEEEGGEGDLEGVVGGMESVVGYGSPASRLLCFHTKDKMCVTCSRNSFFFF